LISKLHIIETENTEDVSRTLLRQAVVLRKKLQLEAERECAQHEIELLELWQTMVDAEEEAAALEAKEIVAGKIIDIHERLLLHDSAMRSTRHELLPAAMAAESILFADLHAVTSVGFQPSTDDAKNREEMLSCIQVCVLTILHLIPHTVTTTFLDTSEHLFANE
jgi:hypothetical protein